MIYICTHKDFDVFSKAGKNCTIISANELTKKYDFPIIYPSNDFKILEHSYSEGYMIKEIYLGIKENNEEWIGINHYRKYFAEPKDELTLPVPYHFNMHQQYATCHNINDLLKVEDIINTFFPEYRMDYQNIEILFPCNMFIMLKKRFYKLV